MNETTEQYSIPPVYDWFITGLCNKVLHIYSCTELMMSASCRAAAFFDPIQFSLGKHKNGLNDAFLLTNINLLISEHNEAGNQQEIYFHAIKATVDILQDRQQHEYAVVKVLPNCITDISKGYKCKDSLETV